MENSDLLYPYRKPPESRIPGTGRAVSHRWAEKLAAEAWKEAQRRISLTTESERFAQYRTDPIRWGEEILGESYTDDVKKVMQSVLENPVTIARSANATGKSHGAARIALWAYTVWEDTQVFLTAAPPLENLKKILWGQVMGIVRRNEQIYANHKRLSSSIARHEQSFITCVAIPTTGTEEERVAKFSGKHAQHLLFIVDEGDAVPEEVYEGIETCMSGGWARLLVMFNPKIRSGPVYHKEKSHKANVVHLSAFNHPNVVTGKNIIDGAVDRETTVRRINQWSVPLAESEKFGEDCFTLPDFLVGATAKALSGEKYPPLEAGPRKITEPTFSYMVLGEYPAQGASQLISEEWISRAVQNWKDWTERQGETRPDGVLPIMGLDIAELGTDANVMCLRYENYVPRLITWTGVDTDKTMLKALEYYRQYNVDMAMVDGTGIGASVAPAMSRMGKKDDNPVRAVSVKVATKPLNFIETELGEFYELRDQLWWALREWLRTDKFATLPPDPYLLDELRAPEYYVDLKGKLRVTDKQELRKRLRRSPDRADALCLTFSPYRRPTITKLNGDQL